MNVKKTTGRRNGPSDDDLRAVHEAENVADLVRVLEERAAGLLDAQLASFFRLEEHDQLQNLVAFRDEGRTRISCPLGQGVAGTVAKENGFYICNVTHDDPLFVEEVDGLPGLDVNNIVSAAVTSGEEVLGVLQVVNKMKSVPFTEEDAYWLQRLSEHGAMAYRRLRRAEDGWRLARDLAAAFAEAIDDKHVSTVGHTDRVRQIALALGQDMNLSDVELEELEFAVLMHDLGRLALAPEVYEVMGDVKATGAGRFYAAGNDRLHLVLTEALLRDLPLPASMAKLREIALAHHEKADGSGFPNGVKTAELPLSARILATANAFDLLTSGRDAEFQGRCLNDEEAAKVVKKRAGTAYDPAVVDRLVRNKLYLVEKRRFPRYDIETPLEVRILDFGAAEPLGDDRLPNTSGDTDNQPHLGTVLETKAVDLSEGGIMFLSPYKLPLHALLKLRIHLPGDTLEALARTARHLPPREGEDSWRVGAYFLWYGKVKLEDSGKRTKGE